jgi:hypothetical protein
VAAAAHGPSRPGRSPFADATPAQIRDALGDQEAAEFAEQSRAAMDRARDLETWRRIAWLTASLGVDGYREMIASAEQRLRTGVRAAGSVPWNQVQEQLAVTRRTAL